MASTHPASTTDAHASPSTPTVSCRGDPATYLVVTCTSCGAPRVAHARHETMQCPRCQATTKIDQAIVHVRTDSMHAARNALGQVNAKREDDTLPHEATTSPADRDAIDRAIRSAREITNQRRRVQAAAQGLTREKGPFDEDTWIEALARLDVPRARALEHLERMKLASLITEPDHGRFEHVDP